jgi:hypothetical protein
LETPGRGHEEVLRKIGPEIILQRHFGSEHRLQGDAAGIRYNDACLLPGGEDPGPERVGCSSGLGSCIEQHQGNAGARQDYG